MALTFIGKSPDPLPLPPGLQLDPRRYVGMIAPPATQRSPTPSCVRVRYQITRPDGRIKPETQDVELVGHMDDMERCTVHQLIALLHEHGPRSLQLLSARHPIELRYHGEKLLPEKLLSDYALKDSSELQVVIKPRLADCEVRAAPAAAESVTRLRFSSHKLVTPLCIDAVSTEMTVADLKARLRQLVASAPIWLVRGPTPPVAAPPPIQLTQKDGTVFEVRVGQQFGKPDGSGGSGGGGKGKKGEGAMLKRASDGLLIEQAVLDPELWQLTLNDPEDHLFNLLHQGVVLPDDALISACGLVNNEMLYLNFKAPWEPDEPVGKPAADKGGKGKKKKK